MPSFYEENGLGLISVILGCLLSITAVVSMASMAVAYSSYRLSLSQPHLIDYVRGIIWRLISESILPLIGGIVLVFSGLRLLNAHVRVPRRATRHPARVRGKALDMLLGKDERMIMGMIGASKDGVLQSDIVIRSGFSKVKTHRILKGLEAKDLIRRGRFGITNKIMLNR